ncbi:MAG: hypothetical protein WB647_07045, partial [Roseiarcus sp.]|uniref:hypothetical protein n=1 Tax=Roseiarcus sp. TaxID=1969460 RepID=UPI003C69D777
NVFRIGDDMVNEIFAAVFCCVWRTSHGLPPLKFRREDGRLRSAFNQSCADIALWIGSRSQ